MITAIAAVVLIAAVFVGVDVIARRKVRRALDDKRTSDNVAWFQKIKDLPEDPAIGLIRG